MIYKSAILLQRTTKGISMSKLMPPIAKNVETFLYNIKFHHEYGYDVSLFFARKLRFLLISDTIDISCLVYWNFSAKKMIHKGRKQSFTTFIYQKYVHVSTLMRIFVILIARCKKPMPSCHPKRVCVDNGAIDVAMVACHLQTDSWHSSWIKDTIFDIMNR